MLFTLGALMKSMILGHPSKIHATNNPAPFLTRHNSPISSQSSPLLLNSLILSLSFAFPFLFRILLGSLDIISRAFPALTFSLDKSFLGIHSALLSIVPNQKIFLVAGESLLATLHFLIVVALLDADSAAFAPAGIANYDFSAHFGCQRWMG